MDTVLLVDGSDNMTPVVLLREAVYNAVGLSAYDLHDFIDFNMWFLNYLVPILQVNTSVGGIGSIILQSRVIWLIGCWASDLTAELRPPLYAAMLHLLRSNDAVGNLNAVTTINSLMDDWKFDADLFRYVINDYITE